MFGLDFIRQLAVRSLAVLQTRTDLVDESKTAYPFLENQDLLLSVGSYNGEIAILKYSPAKGKIALVSTYRETNFQPSWQSVHPSHENIFVSTDEGNPGGLVSFRLDREHGTLTKLARSDGINGTVSIDFHGELVFTAAYSGHSIQSFESNDVGDISAARDTFTYSLDEAGPNRERQESSHPHQVLVDPKGEYLVAPDLGADLLRIYSIDGPKISELQTIPVAPGSGPRHGQFLVLDDPDEMYERNRTMFYLVNELRNKLMVFHTRKFDNGTYGFELDQELDTLPPASARQLVEVPSPTAGEIIISNNRRFLYVSNRNDYSFKDRRFGSSDSIALYEVDPRTGFVTFRKLLQAGGITPRHFSFDKTGNFVAIALQETDTVVIYGVDQETGEFKDTESHDLSFLVGDRPVCVNWL